MKTLARSLATVFVGTAVLTSLAFAKEGAVASKGGAVTLKSSLKVGKRYLMKQHQEVDMQIGKTNASMGLQFDVTPHSDGKNKLVTASVRSMKIEMAGNVMYDSEAADGGGSPMAEMFSTLMDSKVKAVYDENDKLVEVLKDENAARNPLAAMGMGSEQIAAILKSFLDHGFPDKPVKPGEKWTHQDEADLGPTGKANAKIQSVYKGIGTHNGKEYPEIHMSGVIEPGAEAGAAALMKGGTFTGKMFFDPAVGLPRHAVTNMTATMEAGGQEMMMKMVGTMVLEGVEDLKKASTKKAE